MCLIGFTSLKAQELILEENTNILNTSYLNSKEELKDYILDTGDVIKVRFKNQPKTAEDGSTAKKEDINDISYLKPRKNLKNYILDTGDTIKIKFIKTPYLSGIYTIDNDGEIYLPRIKSTYVKGLKTNELKALLAKRYEEFLISPEIEIIIAGFKFIPSGNFLINEEGEIILPAITTDPEEITRNTYVRGLTKDELKFLLEKRYSKFFINPNVFISIIKYKPIRISLKGEVTNPGLIKFPAYTSTNQSTILESLDKKIIKGIDSDNTQENINSKENLSQVFSSRENTFSKDNRILSKQIKRSNDFVTTLSNAIRSAGGLTAHSDISKIEIIRDIPIGKGGGKKRTIINFHSYIEESDNTFDLRLFDGDSIFIPYLSKKNPSLIHKSILSGLSPKFIDINISGKIETAGIIKIPHQGSLSDAINISGPIQPLSGKILLIRYNKDGSLLRKKINYSSKASPGTQGNPYLLSGDTISVQDSFIGKASKSIKAVTEPFIGIYTFKEIINSIK